MGILAVNAITKNIGLTNEVCRFVKIVKMNFPLHLELSSIEVNYLWLLSSGLYGGWLHKKNGVSAVGLQRVLGIGSYRAVWTWLHKFRRLMVFPGHDRLSGKVEVDKTLVGGKKAGKRGRGSEGKTLVAIVIEIQEKGTGRVRLSVIPDASKKVLAKFINENIEVGSTLVTDGWKGYNGISKKGYQHIIEDNTKTIDGQEILPNVHRIASLLKRGLLGTHQNYIGEQYLSYYLDEYTFRHNRRKSNSRGLLFQRLVEQGVVHVPVEYKLIKSM